jgi:hypothetical protein
VLAEGTTIESAPKDFPHYVPGYYTAFFYDPDGIKLEVVYEPTRVRYQFAADELTSTRRAARLRGRVCGTVA